MCRCGTVTKFQNHSLSLPCTRTLEHSRSIPLKSIKNNRVLGRIRADTKIFVIAVDMASLRSNNYYNSLHLRIRRAMQLVFST